jgi:ElaB/YqjD/DUF883 family membrane-anchored ribosome-binding protein
MKPAEKLAPEEVLHEMVEKKDEFVRGVRKTFDTVSDDINRGLKKARYAAGEAMDDARHGIRQNPITTIAITAVGGVFLGLIAGYFLGRRRD